MPTQEKLIDTLVLPDDLRSLTIEQLCQVTEELRDELIDTVSSVGGHFASSLGACELSVALHHCFTTPQDRLIWDVGHQAYVHKMLTGRRREIPSIRTKGGISGFLKRNESQYDAFGAGHAGTSISAAVGMSVALQNNPDRFVVPIIGDGSLTSGMAFEALNHAGHLGLKNFIVVINDNEMSISPNVGALSWLFSKAVTSERSTSVRSRFKNLHRQGYVPDLLYKVLDRVEDLTQGFFAGPALLFAAFGFRYIGPVDGHSVADLVQALENAKQQDVPVVIHTYTVKGKGYSYAEDDPVKWHGVTPFDRSKGEFLPAKSSAGKKSPPTYTQAFADAAIELAQEDERIVALTAAMLSGTGLEKFQTLLPTRCFDVGICEQHAVTAAAGMACEGLRPLCAIYSTFLQRAYDQVIHDVAIQNLPVVFAVDRGGVVGNDGETHQGVFDIAYLRTVPNMIVMSPKDEGELRAMLRSAVGYERPVALRYPRGNGIGAAPMNETIPLGRAELLLRGDDVLLICFGPVVQTGLAVAHTLRQQYGCTTTVINARFAKPLDTELLAREIPRHRLVATLEDHAIEGGFGSAVLEFVNDNAIPCGAGVKRFGVGDEFVPHASQSEQQIMHGYDAGSVLHFIVDRLELKAAVNA